jgi:hypothetical protein
MMEGPGFQTGWTIRGMRTNQVPTLSSVARSISNKERGKSLKTHHHSKIITKDLHG